MKEKCMACGRSDVPMIETPLYFVCEDQEECIAEFSGWNKPESSDVKEVGS